MKKLFTLLLLLFTLVNVAQKKTYSIGILLDNRTEELNPLLLQLQDQIKAVVGEDANIVFPEGSILVNNSNLQKAESNYQQLLNDDTGIILAFGVINNKVIRNQSSGRGNRVNPTGIDENQLEAKIKHHAQPRPGRNCNRPTGDDIPHRFQV